MRRFPHTDSKQPPGDLPFLLFRGSENEGTGVDELVAWQPFYPLPSVCMKDDTTPAAKADLQALRGDLLKEITDMRTQMGSQKEEIKRHFDVIAEQLQHDFAGALGDVHANVKDHEWRIKRLECRAGLR